jgi:hypothetical protein
MSLVDVIVGSALILIVFLALLGLLRTSLLISSSAKAKAGATAVATTQMEYIRSLPYDSVGTIGGIPAGPIAQYATTTMNGIPYVVRTLVEYVDDPKDGSGSGDSNSITTDYKRVRLATSYIFRGEEREVAIISNVSPVSMETTTNGGTLRVSVVDAVGVAVPGASVRVRNTTAVPSIDVTTFSDLSGAIALPGAPTSTAYQITVSKDGYSTAVTYARDATNQNPTPGYLTVAKNQTTTGTFSIDVLSTLLMRTFSPVRTASTTDTFASSANVFDAMNTQVTGGSLTLAGSPGTYAASGSARSTTTAPLYLKSWTQATASKTVPAGTSLSLSIVDAAGMLLPDSALPGNSSGFSSFPVDLAGVSTTTYPGLAMKVQLSTATASSTPELLDWKLSFQEGPVPLPNVAFTLTGAKKQGTTGAGLPIYKTIVSTTTDALGTRSLTLEWDVYSLLVTGLAIVSSSSTPPYTLSPGASMTSDLILQ